MDEAQLAELEARIARQEALSVASAARLAAEVRRLQGERLRAAVTSSEYPWDEATARSAFAKLTWADVANPEQMLSPDERKAALFALSWRLEAWPLAVAENARLRAALEVYGDTDNWAKRHEEWSYTHSWVEWVGEADAPWLIAREALAGGEAMEKREVIEAPGLPRRDGTTRVGFWGQTPASVEAPVQIEARELGRISAELFRLQQALAILGGQEHVVALGGRHSAYARGVLAGADPGDVAGAIARGEERQG